MASQKDLKKQGIAHVRGKRYSKVNFSSKGISDIVDSESLAKYKNASIEIYHPTKGSVGDWDSYFKAIAKSGFSDPENLENSVEYMKENTIGIKYKDEAIFLILEKNEEIYDSFMFSFACLGDDFVNGFFSNTIKKGIDFKSIYGNVITVYDSLGNRHNFGFSILGKKEDDNEFVLPGIDYNTTAPGDEKIEFLNPEEEIFEISDGIHNIINKGIDKTFEPNDSHPPKYIIE